MWNGRIFVEDDLEEDGTTQPPNEEGEHVCDHCHRGFKYLFLLKLHKKSPKRACATVRACFFCKQPSNDLKSRKLADNDILLCENCKRTVSFVVVEPN